MKKNKDLKRITKSNSKVNIKDYGFRMFCYDIFKDLLYKYPDGVTKPIFLKIIAADKNPHPFDDSLHPKYNKLFNKYYQPNSKHIIVDITLLKVPLEIAEESDMGGVGSENFSVFSLYTIGEYKIKRKYLYEIYFENYKKYMTKDDFTYDFFNYIFSKIVSVQPTIYIPQGFDLWDLNCLPEKLTDTKYFEIYLSNLNYIRQHSGTGSDAFSQFLIDSFASIKNKLKEDNLIFMCHNCNNLAPYISSKKYCSYECRKQAESKRYYQKHGKKIRQTNRGEMRETRKLYKKLGVKK